MQSLFSRQRSLDFLSLRDKIISYALPILLVGITLVARVFHIIPNFSPVGAIALFAGTMMVGVSRWVALIGLVISDIVMASIGTYGLSFWAYLAGSPAVYVAFGLTTIMGMANKHKKSLVTAINVLTSAVVFFVVTNLACWPAYGLTYAGLVTDFTAAIPFFRSTLESNVIYSSLLFGALWVATQLVRRGPVSWAR